MTSTTLSTAQCRDLRDAIRSGHVRIGELHQAFQQDSVRLALEALYERSVGPQRIDFDSLTGDEAALLLLCLEQTVTRQLIDFGEQLILNQQNAAKN